MRSAGFGTIEAIVAAALFATMAASITSTLVLARRIQTDLAAERYATQLAVASLERLRAGGSPRPSETARGFTISESLQPWSIHTQLLQARVRVTWDNPPRSFELETLIAR